MGWPDRTLRGTKKPQAAWRPAAIFVIQSLSQPQVRARRPKVKIKILAAQGVADLLTAPLHGRYHTGMDEFVNGVIRSFRSSGQMKSQQATEGNAKVNNISLHNQNYQRRIKECRPRAVLEATDFVRGRLAG